MRTRCKWVRFHQKFTLHLLDGLDGTQSSIRNDLLYDFIIYVIYKCGSLNVSSYMNECSCVSYQKTCSIMTTRKRTLAQSTSENRSNELNRCYPCAEDIRLVNSLGHIYIYNQKDIKNLAGLTNSLEICKMLPIQYFSLRIIKSTHHHNNWFYKYNSSIFFK